MFEPLRQLFILLVRARKIWLIPIVLFLVIIALIILNASISPVPVFLYPII